MAAVASDKMSPGAQKIIQSVDNGVQRKDPRPSLDHGLGRSQHSRAGTPAHTRDTFSCRYRSVRFSSARLLNFRSGRRRPLNQARVPHSLLHRHALHARWRRILPRHLDRHLRRPLLAQRRWRRLHHIHHRLGQRQHAREGSHGQTLHPAMLHSRRRYAVVPRPH